MAHLARAVKGGHSHVTYLARAVKGGHNHVAYLARAVKGEHSHVTYLARAVKGEHNHVTLSGHNCKSFKEETSTYCLCGLQLQHRKISLSRKVFQNSYVF